MDVRRAAGFVLLVIGGAGFALIAAALGVSLVQALARGSLLGVLAVLGGALLTLALPLALAFALFLVGRRLAFPKPFEPTPRARPVPPVPVPSEADVRDLAAPVTACPDCGFLGVRMPQLSDGVWPGGGEIGDRRVCPRCGYQGIAVSFRSGADYRDFVAGLA